MQTRYIHNRHFAMKDKHIKDNPPPDRKLEFDQLPRPHTVSIHWGWLALIAAITVLLVLCLIWL